MKEEGIRHRIEAQEKTLARQLDWIKNADSKAQMCIALNLAMIGGAVALSPKFAQSTPWTFILTVVALTCPGIALYRLASVVLPRLGRPSEKEVFHLGRMRVLWRANDDGKPYKGESLLFFGLIKQMSKDDHAKEAMGRTDEQYLGDLIEQTYVNAEIADLKFGFLRRGMRWMIGGVFLWLPAVYLLWRN